MLGCSQQQKNTLTHVKIKSTVLFCCWLNVHQCIYILAYWAVPFKHKGAGIIKGMMHCMNGFVTSYWGHTGERDPAACPQAKNPQLLEPGDGDAIQHSFQATKLCKKRAIPLPANTSSPHYTQEEYHLAADVCGCVMRKKRLEWGWICIWV